MSLDTNAVERSIRPLVLNRKNASSTRLDAAVIEEAGEPIYVHVSSFAQHRVPRDWLDQQINQRFRVLSVCRRLACLRSCRW